MRSTTRRLVVAMLVGVLLYGAAVLYAGYQDIKAVLAQFRWVAMAGALGLASTNYLLRFLKWEYYLARLGVVGVPKVDSLLVFLSGFVLTITPGKVGEVFKSAVLARTHGVAMERTASIVIAERLTDVIAVIILILLGSTGFAGGMAWALTGGVAVTLGLGLILWRRPAQFFVTWMSGKQRLSSAAPKVEQALSALRQISTPTALIVPIALSVVGWGCEGVGLYLLLWGFDAPAPLPLCVFFYATASLAGALIPLPGGLGVVEAIIQEQLVHLGGVPQAPATASMILVRFATLWWAVVVGFVALAILRNRYSGLRFTDRMSPAPAGGGSLEDPPAAPLADQQPEGGSTPTGQALVGPGASGSVNPTERSN